jgi:NAD(P)-dependent dehydrogenase (short-subunit alcohol dehydrogenase family)
MQTMTDLFYLSGKTAIVTGACGLLGREYVDILAEAGADVIIADLDLDVCRQVAH